MPQPPSPQRAARRKSRSITLLVLCTAGLWSGLWWAGQSGVARPSAERPAAVAQAHASAKAPLRLESVLETAVHGEDARPVEAREATAGRRAAASSAPSLAARADDPRARFEELRQLSRTSPAEAVPALRAFIDATVGEPGVQLQRLSAIALLGEIHEVPTRTDLFAVYESADPATRRAAALALERQGDACLVQQELLEMQTGFTAADGGVRMRAVEQVARLGSPEVAPFLLPMLADPNSEVRIRALDGLRRAGDGAVLPEVEALLDDPVERVRERARRTLAALRPRPSAGSGD